MSEIAELQVEPTYYAPGVPFTLYGVYGAMIKSLADARRLLTERCRRGEYVIVGFRPAQRGDLFLSLGYCDYDTFIQECKIPHGSGAPRLIVVERPSADKSCSPDNDRD